MSISRISRPVVALVGIALAATTNLQAQRADLLPPKAREKVVERAEALVNRGAADAARLPGNGVNPFDPTAGKAVVEAAAPQPKVVARATLSDEQKLKAIAPQIQPTGTMFLGGEAYLLFGQKKFKVGDTLPIIFEGDTYNVLVTDIQTINFSIRLGESELVRSIKPVTRP